MSDYEYHEYGSITEEFPDYLEGFYESDYASDYFIDMEYCA